MEICKTLSLSNLRDHIQINVADGEHKEYVSVNTVILKLKNLRNVTKEIEVPLTPMKMRLIRIVEIEMTGHQQIESDGVYYVPYNRTGQKSTNPFWHGQNKGYDKAPKNNLNNFKKDASKRIMHSKEERHSFILILGLQLLLLHRPFCTFIISVFAPSPQCILLFSYAFILFLRIFNRRPREYTSSATKAIKVILTVLYCAGAVSCSFVGQAAQFKQKPKYCKDYSPQLQSEENTHYLSLKIEFCAFTKKDFFYNQLRGQCWPARLSRAVFFLLFLLFLAIQTKSSTLYALLHQRRNTRQLPNQLYS
eukprot:TRINITY_DN1377_c0_g1_i2.p1 TRINITY_DN1377_c0_g1~~TRINITY_DN1377_c0_g1_i2.p1  ORF type:complete len:307 (+),score=-15.24 TRINITY_DN1377_c0_g1_i2:402-1322(+)